MRTRLAAASAVWLAAPLLASCGIPDGSGPEVVQEAPTDFEAPSSVEVEQFRPTDNARTTVEHFLRAASGDPDTAALDERLNEFTETRKEFSGSSAGIDLLEGVEYDTDESGDINTATVTVTGSVAGSYQPDGRVSMYSAPRDYEAEFALERSQPGGEWTIMELPSQVTLLYDQFDDAYEQAPLYFPASGRNDLVVSDLRWIYGRLDEATERNLRLEWLLLGPSDWANQSSISAIPIGTTGEVGEEDGTDVIDLTPGDVADVSEQNIEAIAAQVAWSLRLTGPFELRIGGETVASGELDEWRGWNAIPRIRDQTGYFIAEDTVWLVRNDSVGRASAEHDWVGFEAPGLREAAPAEDGRIAAVVAEDDEARLRIGTGGDDMETVDELEGDLRDPHWLDEETVLLIDDGVLTAVTVADGSIQVLGGEEVSSLAPAPDGRRILYVEDGRAWAVPLSQNADGNFQIQETSRRIGLSIGDVTDVAWSSENFVWVAGDGPGDEQLFQVAIDNSRVEAQSGTSPFPTIEQVAANPADPTESDQIRGEPVYVAINGGLYRVHTSTLQPVGDEGDGQPTAGTAPFTLLD
ncbi:LpqB family beta-propeller domain-containing protein [Glycomyces xiaoerkulensis]|uniref:LpqB family beta-propeller domain-containing protein n=1 Tax=Glycomyces xiaoerkulensis TaxID=2038139 RepID=UPI000C263A2A|nr:LpqB family beta-propeller domain-containing protein [Glycomyces xiaoerkulensis]